MITLVIFSMDRALQCDSLLQSIQDHGTGVSDIVVIARASSERHALAYDKMMTRHDSIVSMVSERNGVSCSSALAEVVKLADHICLTVDDQVFYRPSNFNTARAHLEKEHGFVWSWRLGRRLGVTADKTDHWLCSVAGTRDKNYRYLFHSDGALYRRGDYVRLLDMYVPGWETKSYIPNDLENEVARMQPAWQMSVGPHVGPLEATCKTWQLNKQSTTEGRYGAPWCTIPETKLDALAEAFLAGKRVDNTKLYADISWTTRFQQPDSFPTHVHACEEASRFYAGLIR